MPLLFVVCKMMHCFTRTYHGFPKIPRLEWTTLFFMQALVTQLTGGGNSSLSGSPLKKPPRGPRGGLIPAPPPVGVMGSKRAPGGTAPLI